MPSIKLKKKKEKDGHEIAGKIITFFFAVLVIIGIYFLVDLFRQREINYETIEGSWKLSGDTAVIYKIEKFDEKKGYGVMTEREEGESSPITYHYTLTSKDEGSYKIMNLQQVDVGGYKVGEPKVMSITGVSKAQLSVIIDGSKMKSLTRQDIF